MNLEVRKPGRCGFSCLCRRERSCRVDFSIPGASNRTAVCRAVGVLDSGAGVTAMSTSVVRKVMATFPVVSVLERTNQPHPVKRRFACFGWPHALLEVWVRETSVLRLCLLRTQLCSLGPVP